MKLSATTTDSAKTNSTSDPVLPRTKPKPDFNRLLEAITDEDAARETSSDGGCQTAAEAQAEASVLLPTETITPAEPTATIVLEQFMPLDADDVSLPADEADEKLLALENDLTSAANQLIDAFRPANANALSGEATAMEGLASNLTWQPTASGDEVTFSIDSGVFAGVQVHVSHDQTTGAIAVRFITAGGNAIPGVSQNLHRIARSLRRNGLRVKELSIAQRTLPDVSDDEDASAVRNIFHAQH